MDEPYFGGRRKGNGDRGAAGKIPVFGILERGGKVRVEVIRNTNGESLLEIAIKKSETWQSHIHGYIRNYNSLISYGFRYMGNNRFHDLYDVL
jgi:transposase